jgi:hypothetical protein
MMESTRLDRPVIGVPGTDAGAGPTPPAPPVDLAALPVRAQSALAEVLADEVPRLVVKGEAGSALVATDSRVLVYKRGARAGLPFAHRVKPFEYETVTRFELRELPGNTGVLVIQAPLKVAACSSYWADDRDDPWKARNALPLKAPLSRFEPALGELRRLAAAHQEMFGRVTPAPTGEAVVQEWDRPVERPVEQSADQTLDQTAAGESPAVPDGERVSCSRCGTALSRGWRYCPGCGAFSESPPRASRDWLRRPRS